MTSSGKPMADTLTTAQVWEVVRHAYTRIAELETALRRCADKLKIEYDLQQPDAAPTECWAEAEAAWDWLPPKDT
jgi:hypothetical protein